MPVPLGKVQAVCAALQEIVDEFLDAGVGDNGIYAINVDNGRACVQVSESAFQKVFGGKVVTHVRNLQQGAYKYKATLHGMEIFTIKFSNASQDVEEVVVLNSERETSASQSDTSRALHSP